MFKFVGRNPDRGNDANRSIFKSSQYQMKPEIKRSFSSSKTIQKETNLYDESKIIESSVNRMK
jgi:hypothetical protein